MKEAPSVQLVYDRDCPNVGRARESIAAALREVGLPVAWTEFDRADESTPDTLRAFGSPTVLVHGLDVSGRTEEARSDANSCRVYRDGTGRLHGFPSVDQIAAALRTSGRPGPGAG